MPYWRLPIWNVSESTGYMTDWGLLHERAFMTSGHIFSMLGGLIAKCIYVHTAVHPLIQ